MALIRRWNGSGWVDVAALPKVVESQTQAQAEDSTDVVARLTTGQRLYQAIAKWALTRADSQLLQTKLPVRTMALANITLSGTQTVTGVALVAGDRVLVNAQTTASQNGIYIVAAGAWTRASDADTIEKLLGAYVYVAEGTWATVQARSKVKRGDILGTTSIAFVWTLDDGLYDQPNGLPRLDGSALIKPAALPPAALALAAYPVGAFYISAVSTSPATLFGGTWTQVSDRMLIGIGGNSRWDTALEVGGSESVTLTAEQSGLPAHSHGVTDPTHAHSMQNGGAPLANGGGAAANLTTGGGGYVMTGIAAAATGISIQNNSAAGASQSHDNMPPFIAVYMWRRTA